MKEYIHRHPRAEEVNVLNVVASIYLMQHEALMKPLPYKCSNQEVWQSRDLDSYHIYRLCGVVVHAQTHFGGCQLFLMTT